MEIEKNIRDKNKINNASCISSLDGLLIVNIISRKIFWTIDRKRFAIKRGLVRIR